MKYRAAGSYSFVTIIQDNLTKALSSELLISLACNVHVYFPVASSTIATYPTFGV